MFSNITRPETSADEGIVAQVDSIRKLCKVKTLSGQSLSNVRWTESSGGSGRAGDRSTPSIGDSVMLDYRLGTPVIVGYLPRLQSGDNVFPTAIDSGVTDVDTGNLGPGGRVTWADRSKPNDSTTGDRLFISEGGAMAGILRYGTALLKASALAQVIVSKLDDVVKIISRNFEHYTDVSSDIVKNIGGRVYRYIGYTNNYGSSVNEDYQYNLYYGDTVLAESTKTNYLSPGGGVANGVIFKEQMKQGSNVVERTVDLSGSEVLTISNGGVFSKRTTTAGSSQLNYNDQNIITVTADAITLQRSDGAILTMTADGVKVDYKGGEIKMHDAGVDTTFGGHFVKVNSGGVQLG